MKINKQFSEERNNNNLSQKDAIVINKLKMIALLSGIFMCAQIVGGLLANSIAILADAFHLLSDIIAYSISLCAVIMSNKHAPQYLSFGYEKSQPLGALANVGIIWVVTVLLFIEATNRIWQKSMVQEPLYMLLTSVFGLGCNLYIMRILHSDESYDHDCSHEKNFLQLNQIEKIKKINIFSLNLDDQHVKKDLERAEPMSTIDSQEAKDQQISCNSFENIFTQNYQKLTCSQNNKHNNKQPTQDKQHSLSYNINIQAAYIHIISDIILSIGVILSATTIYFCAQKDVWTLWQLADPICTYIFSIVAIYSTLQITQKSCILLMNGCTNKDLIPNILTEFAKLSQIESLSCLKIWNGKKQTYHGYVKIICKSKSLQSIKNLQECCTQIFNNYKIDGAIQITCLKSS